MNTCGVISNACCSYVISSLVLKLVDWLIITALYFDGFDALISSTHTQLADAYFVYLLCFCTPVEDEKTLSAESSGKSSPCVHC